MIYLLVVCTAIKLLYNNMKVSSATLFGQSYNNMKFDASALNLLAI